MAPRTFSDTAPRAPRHLLPRLGSAAFIRQSPPVFPLGGGLRAAS